MSDAIRQHIAQLRDEVEKRYHEGLEAIKRLEQTLLGSAAPQEPIHAGGVASPPTTAAPSAAPLGRAISQVEAVLVSLRESPKTIGELAETLPTMTQTQIRAVLYSSRIRTQVKKKRTSRGLVFNLKSKAPPDATPAPKANSTAFAVLNLIEENPSGLTASEVANALEGKIESKAYNKRNTISSALYNLKDAGKIRYDAASKKYAPATTQA